MGNHHCLPPQDPNSVYLYCASSSAAVLFSVLYGITLTAHIAQAIVYKKTFCWVICMAAGWEFAGLVTRSLSTFNQTSVEMATPSQLLILLAPLWINAFSYMLLARVVWFYREDGRVFGVRAPRIGMLFVLCDITAFLVQATGGVMVTPSASASTVKLGFNIYRIGLGVQQAFILIFLALAVRFHVMVKRQDSASLYLRGDLEEARRLHGEHPGEWKPLLYALYTGLSLITVRIVYRLIEFSSGIYGYIPEHEWEYYVWDAFLMWLVLILFNIFHPGRWLVGENASWPKKSRKEKKAEKRARKEAKAAEKTARKEAKAEEKQARKASKRAGTEGRDRLPQPSSPDGSFYMASQYGPEHGRVA